MLKMNNKFKHQDFLFILHSLLYNPPPQVSFTDPFFALVYIPQS